MDRATFARDLAQALRDAEEQRNEQAEEDPLDVLHRTYQRLCHDDPEAISGRGAQLLREALLNVESPYALSARLVRGIQQQCNNINNSTDSASASSQSQPQNSSTATETTEAPLFVSPTAAATTDGASVYATLAWTVHAHIPLMCIRTRKLSEAVAYLGSLVETNNNPTEQPQRENNNETDGAQGQQQQQHANLDAFLQANGAANDADPQNGNMAQNGHQHDDEAAAAAPFGNGHTEANHIINADNDSLAEVFAAESDDSDFEFESDWNPNEQVAALQEWAESVQEMWDPLQLSKHNVANADPITWNDVAASVTELLQTYSSSAVAALDVQSQWKTLRCSEHLTELIVALLVPTAASRSPLLTTVENSANDDYTPDHWRRLGLHMLQLFAAYVQHHSLTTTTTTATANISTAATSLLEDYLRLLRILMQSSSPSTDKISAITVTEPAVLVGLGSLSALCSEVLSLQQKAIRHSTTVSTIQAAVLESCDDLVDWLEAAAINKKNDDNAANEAVQALQWTYLSLFQILTQPALNSSKNNAAMPSSTAQTLLNSGLLRQWLLVLGTAKTTSTTTTTTEKAATIAVQSSIWELCLASPALLGKYTWRFPGLAQQVTDDEFEDGDSTMQVFLWNLLGIHLASLTQPQQAGAAPKVQWKSSKARQQKQPQTVSRAVTAESCRQMAWSLFQTMCQRALQILTDWKLRCEHQLDDTLSAVGGSQQQHNQQQQQVLLDFGRLADRLTVPLLRTIFLEQMVVTKTDADGNDSSLPATAIIREDLQPIQRILSQWPSASSAVFAKNIEDSDDGEKEAVKEHRTPTDNKKKQRMEREEIVNALRKSVKTILSALDDDSANISSGRQHQSFSSKAD